MKSIAEKPKKAAAAPTSQMELMQRLMRQQRLPGVQYFVEQLSEGVLMPEGWAAQDDAFEPETEDLEVCVGVGEGVWVCV